MMMKYSTLGKIGPRVSKIGLGLAALGRPGYINLGHAEDLKSNYNTGAMQWHTCQMLDLAWNLGIRYFDVARSYGKAETFLGAWLESKTQLVELPFVASKWGYTYTANWQVNAKVHEVKDHSLVVLQKQVLETRQSLGKNPDLYQIHSATLETKVLENTQVLRRLAQLKARGVKIGLSLSGVDQATTLEKALAIEIEGVRLFDVVQATFNLLEKSVAPALTMAHNEGLGVVVKEALANGRLTFRNTDVHLKPEWQLLKTQADRLKTTVDALALAYVLKQPFVNVVLSGAANPEHLKSNLTALDVVWDEEASEVLNPLVQTPEDYWAARKQMDWN
ncbi:aldo/keto reductase [uncultured Microscilla sp.]|uniref:aldo/keto reductase n=1 Tax=uncultured Microscilla sp. TaxID=432653 RepID=UPI00260FADA9|nr:aldo/keto reductase [uncultured Microscilla sp.]